MFFYTLLKKSLGDPYLKLLDFSQLLVADTLQKFLYQIFSLHPLTAPLGHQVQKWIWFFIVSTNLYMNPTWNHFWIWVFFTFLETHGTPWDLCEVFFFRKWKVHFFKKNWEILKIEDFGFDYKKNWGLYQLALKRKILIEF